MGDEELQVDRFRVDTPDGFSMPCITMHDRRNVRQPLVRFLFQRHLEAVLYGRSDGSSGPIWKLLTSTGLGTTALSVSKASVTDSLIMQCEYDQIMAIFKQTVAAVDPCSVGRIRVCTLLPLATAAALARTFGRSASSLAFLRAFTQSVPEAWSLAEERERNAANFQEDLVLNEKLDDLEFEAEEMSFADELKSMPFFSKVSH